MAAEMKSNKKQKKGEKKTSCLWVKMARKLCVAGMKLN